MDKLNTQKREIKIVLLTGLHIGSGNDDIQIGGVDSAVIKDPISKLPIIPGSSIKGKLRFLLDTDPENKDSELNDEVNTFFGATSSYLKKQKENQNYEETPTRLLFRDLLLSQAIDENKKTSDYEMMKSGELNTEFKSEIKMNRETGKVDSFGPRTIERVPSGLTFEGELIIRSKNDEEMKRIIKLLERSFMLLENDALGGSGSRGYGQVKISFK